MSETVAMDISGHVTRSVFSRYNSAATEDEAEAFRALEARRAALAGKGNVAAIGRSN